MQAVTRAKHDDVRRQDKADEQGGAAAARRRRARRTPSVRRAESSGEAMKRPSVLKPDTLALGGPITGHAARYLGAPAKRGTLPQQDAADEAEHPDNQ